MLIFEIVFLIFFTKEIAISVAETDENQFTYKMLAIFLWILGEIPGLIVGYIAVFLSGGSWLYIPFSGILGGLVGALVAFAIVGNLPKSPAAKAATDAKAIPATPAAPVNKDRAEIESLFIIGGFIGIFGLTILAAVFFAVTTPERITNLISAFLLLLISIICITLGKRKQRA